MAMKKLNVEDSVWSSPIWPGTLPDLESMKIVYGTVADELVIRFWRDRRYDTVVVPVTTPEEDYASGLTDFSSGAIVGIHVYPLLALGVKRHPSWERLADQNPPPEALARIVADVKELFDRYGVGDPPVG